jgi:hypothetical protein
MLDLAAIARGAGGELTADATFTTEHMTYPYGVHLAQVRIERDSCAIAVERFFVGYDIGRAVNPMLVEGQIVGGAAQGIGAALLEEFVYDASGQPQSVTLADYLMPTIAEIPDINVILFEDARRRSTPSVSKVRARRALARRVRRSPLRSVMRSTGSARSGSCRSHQTASTLYWPSFRQRSDDDPRLIGRGSDPSAASAGRRRFRSSCR